MKNNIQKLISKGIKKIKDNNLLDGNRIEMPSGLSKEEKREFMNNLPNVPDFFNEFLSDVENSGKFDVDKNIKEKLEKFVDEKMIELGIQ